MDLNVKSNGAAVLIDRTWVNLTIKNDIFIKCRCDGKSYVGGGIWTNAFSLIINCSTFDRCFAYNAGSAFHTNNDVHDVSVSSFIICNTLYTEYLINEDVVETQGQSSLMFQDGNITNCSPANTGLLTIKSLKSSIAKMSYLSLVSINDIPNGFVIYSSTNIHFLNCNFFRMRNIKYLFGFEDSPGVVLYGCAFDDITAKGRNTGTPSEFTLNNCFVSDPTIASLLGTSVSGESVLTINVDTNKSCVIKNCTCQSTNYFLSLISIFCFIIWKMEL